MPFGSKVARDAESHLCAHFLYEQRRALSLSSDDGDGDSDFKHAVCRKFSAPARLSGSHSTRSHSPLSLTAAQQRQLQQKQEEEEEEEKRWGLACKLAHSVGASYLCVSFGPSEDDILEVHLSSEDEESDSEDEEGGSAGVGTCCESLDEVFDFSLLEDHVLV